MFCTVNYRPLVSNYQLSHTGFKPQTSEVGGQCVTTDAQKLYKKSIALFYIVYHLNESQTQAYFYDTGHTSYQFTYLWDEYLTFTYIFHKEFSYSESLYFKAMVCNANYYIC